MRSELFPVKIITERGVQGEAVDIQAEDRHLFTQFPLNVRSPSKQMHGPLEAFRRNRSPSVSCRDAVPQQKRLRDALVQMWSKRGVFGHDHNMLDVSCKGLSLQDNFVKVYRILHITRHRHEWAHFLDHVEVPVIVVILPTNVDEADLSAPPNIA